MQELSMIRQWTLSNTFLSTPCQARNNYIGECDGTTERRKLTLNWSGVLLNRTVSAPIILQFSTRPQRISTSISKSMKTTAKKNQINTLLATEWITTLRHWIRQKAKMPNDIACCRLQRRCQPPSLPPPIYIPQNKYEFHVAHVKHIIN